MAILNKKQMLALLTPASVLMGGVSAVSADSESVGFLDVFVAHNNLDDAIRYALSEGINVERDDTQILTGNTEETRKNIANTKEYYLAKQKEIIEAVDKYKQNPTGEKPKLRYHLYEIRSTPTSNSSNTNNDGEALDVQLDENIKYIQVMKNQLINLTIENESLPEGRFDKINNLTTTVDIPDGVEVDKDSLKSNDFWNISYNEETRKLTISSTPRYLVEMNKNQALNNGAIGGSMKDEFKYTLPKVTFKATEDNKEFKLSFETIINNEYMVSNKTVMIKTTAPEPEKHNKNDKGIVIDGKTVLPNTINNYTLKWDFDQYKGVNIDRSMQEKGLALYDVAPFEALEFLNKISIKDGDKVIATAQADGSFKDAEGNTIDGLKWEMLDKVDGIPSSGKVLKIGITGYDHPFYKEYVEKGKSLTVDIPMKTKQIKNDGDGYNGNTFNNVYYQDDFGNIYKSNNVINDVTKIKPNKDATLSRANLESLDLKANEKATIEEGTTFQYRLQGTGFAKNTDITSYEIRKEFHEADDYDGEYFVETGKEIQFKKGTAMYERYKATNGRMPANTDVTKYTTQTIERNVSKNVNTGIGLTSNTDKKITKVNVKFDEDFINSIDFENSEFQMDAFFQAKRNSNTQGVVSKFTEIVNGSEFDTNEVTTNSRKNSFKAFEDRYNELMEQLRKEREKQNERDNNQDLSIRKLSKQVDENTNALAELAKAFGSKKVNTIKIYKPSIISEADAINYVVERGVVPSDIVKVELDSDNHYVVKYKDNNGEASATPKNKEIVQKQRIKYEFFTLTSKDEVLVKLKSYGVDISDVTIEQDGTKFVAVVNVKK